MNHKIKSLLAAGSVLTLACAAHAQTYSIDWYKVAGGGGTSSNTTYSLAGTIGQADAGGAMTAGGYTVTGGFWSMISVVQTPGAPLLQITNAGAKVIVYWSPSATGFTLQTNSNPATTNWVNYTGTVINNAVTNASPAVKLFYRLKK